MYDSLARIYDRFIDWPARLGRELPALTAWLGDPLGHDGTPRRLADVACGTGGHARALAELGWAVTGFDPSEEALAVARERDAERKVTWRPAAYGGLAGQGAQPFEVLISLGNSLPHVVNEDELRATFADFERVLAPGGRLLLGLRNLTRVVAQGDRWQPPKAARDEDGAEWLFDRFYDFFDDDKLIFNFVCYRRPAGAAGWDRTVQATWLRAWPSELLLELLSGWEEPQAWSTLAGEPFDERTSGDLFLTARRP